MNIERLYCLEHNFYEFDVAAKVADGLGQIAGELRDIDNVFRSGSREPVQLSELTMRWLNLSFEDDLTLIQAAGLYREVSARLYEMAQRLDPAKYVMSIYGP